MPTHFLTPSVEEYDHEQDEADDVAVTHTAKTENGARARSEERAWCLIKKNKIHLQNHL